MSCPCEDNYFIIISFIRTKSEALVDTVVAEKFTVHLYHLSMQGYVQNKRCCKQKSVESNGKFFIVNL
jgi:hypothetical protein